MDFHEFTFSKCCQVTWVICYQMIFLKWIFLQCAPMIVMLFVWTIIVECALTASSVGWSHSGNLSETQFTADNPSFMCSHAKGNKTNYEWRCQSSLNVPDFLLPGEGRKTVVIILLYLLQHLQHWLTLVRMFSLISMEILCGFGEFWNSQMRNSLRVTSYKETTTSSTGIAFQTSFSTGTQHDQAGLWLQPCGLYFSEGHSMNLNFFRPSRAWSLGFPHFAEVFEK